MKSEQHYLGVKYSCGVTGRARLSQPFVSEKAAEAAASELHADGFTVAVVSYPSRGLLQWCISRQRPVTEYAK